MILLKNYISISDVKQTDLPNFLKEPVAQAVLNANNFDGLFEGWINYGGAPACASLTYLLDYSNIDYLKYMTKIPDYCFAYMEFESDIFEIPDNIKELGYRIFTYAENLDTVIVPKGINMEDRVFLDAPIKHLIFRDTMHDILKRVGFNSLEDFKNYIRVSRNCSIEFDYRGN